MAFEDCYGLTSISLPNLDFIDYENNIVLKNLFSGVLTDSSYSVSVVIRGGTSIGGGAFDRCSGLTSITIPNSVTSIGERAFYECSGLTSITIPNSVTSIGEKAFQDCSGLTSITIPNSVTSIVDGAFDGCSGLTSITLPNLDFIDYENNIVLNNLFSGVLTDSSYSVSVVIRGGTSIGEGAFEDCSGLTSIKIPNSVTSIGERAFDECSGLTSITIPNSVTSIGNYAFQYCEGLTSITIPNSVTSIGNYAFQYCEGLTSITIPNSVTSIGNGSFYQCYRLTSITLPNLESSVNCLDLEFSSLNTINYGGTQSKWLSDFGYSSLEEWKSSYGFNGDIHFGG